MIPIIIAIIGLLGSLTAYYFTKKQEIEAEQRKLKQEYYKNFIKALSDVAIDNFDDDAQKRLSESFNSLIVIAAPKVVQRLMGYHNFVRVENTEIDRDSKQWAEKHDELLRVLIAEIRKDIYTNERSGRADAFLSQVHLVGRNPKNRIK